jgi:hypothetical protein
MRALGSVAVAAALCLIVSGCSTSTVFPAVHDMPGPRVDTTLTPEELKQAKDNLTSERDHLSADAQAITPPLPNAGLPPQPAPPSTASIPPQPLASKAAAAPPKP